MKVILFEDNQTKNLYPITLARPSFDILCGGVSLFEVIKREFKGSKLDFLVRDYLNDVTRQRYKTNSVPDDKVLFLSGSLVPSFEIIKLLAKKILAGKSSVLKTKNQIFGGYLDLKELGLSLEKIKKLKTEQVENFLQSLNLKKIEINLPIFYYPWQVITYNEQILNSNLKYLKNEFIQKAPGIFIGKNVVIPKEAVLDSSHGLIVIGDGTQLLPFCHLVGPLYLGRGCLVKEFTSLKYNCCLGDVCKVGGEVEAVVLQGYCNKAHGGFLGYSYLGEWSNLGAGTVSSNLKNSYGSIKMAGIDTGHQFLGCIVGDYARTAINTSIYTGKMISISSHLYGTVTTDVPAFTHYAKDFGCVVEYDL